MKHKIIDGQSTQRMYDCIVRFFTLWQVIFGVGDQLLGVILQQLYRMLEFTMVEPLAVDNFPSLCNELAGPFETHLFGFPSE